jgi:hypothetical protein
VPSSLVDDVPRCVDRLCAALLEKKPDARPASADAVVAMIDDALAELDGKRAAGSSSRTPKPTRAPRLSSNLTRREVPPGTDVPRVRRTRRWMLGGAAALVALAAAGFGVLHLSDTPGEPTDTPDGPVDPHGANRKEIALDDGELLVRVLVPDPITSGHEVRPHLEIRNKLGQPVTAKEVVVTVADAKGATGLSAHPHGDHAGHYDFAYRFPAAGHYTVRVFPPSVDSVFELPLDVK